MHGTARARETKGRKARRHNAFRQWARRDSNPRPLDYESRTRQPHAAFLAPFLPHPVSFCPVTDTGTDAATDTVHQRPHPRTYARTHTPVPHHPARPRVRDTDDRLDALYRERIARDGFATAAKASHWIMKGERMPNRPKEEAA